MAKEELVKIEQLKSKEISNEKEYLVEIESLKKKYYFV